jgi:vacuolar-type H+-ATPase subunit F/Vma7
MVNMGTIVFIGDELTATGFRLTGIETITPSPATVRDAFAAARRRAGMIVITAALSEHIPPSELEDALLAETPILAIVPDILARTSPPDLTRRLRGALGIEL